MRTPWLPWHDRILAIQVLADDPFDFPRGEIIKRWNKVTSTLAGIEGSGERTGASCKQHVEILPKKLKACLSLPLSQFLFRFLSFTLSFDSALTAQ